MLTLSGHVLVSLDIETTGLLDAYHDIVQVACVPLDDNLDPMDISPFYMDIRPQFPERADPVAMSVNGLDMDYLMSCPTCWQVADCLDEWFEGLSLGMGKKMIPLCQNSPFDVPFMKTWLGALGYDKYFARRGRDTMYSALAVNDRAAWRNEKIPFKYVGLKHLCEYFGINIEGHHDALCDCIATAKVYRELLRMEL